MFGPGVSTICLILPTDYGHPERALFQKLETFGLGQTDWAEILWGIWGISGQTISSILSLWVPCSWESVAGSLLQKTLIFRFKTPKYSQKKILAIKNLGNSFLTSVFGNFTIKNGLQGNYCMYFVNWHKVALLKSAKLYLQSQFSTSKTNHLYNFFFHWRMTIQGTIFSLKNNF